MALLSVENIFFAPAKLKEKADRARLKFLSPDGDFGMLLNVYKQYKVGQVVPLRVCRVSYLPILLPDDEGGSAVVF